MRFVVAIALFIAALLSCALGIAQRTVLAGPANTVLVGHASDTAPIAVIDGGTLSQFGGTQTVTVSGTGSLVLAYGRTIDVTGWIENAKVTTVKLNAAKTKLVTRTSTRGSATTPSPAGSDLWLDERDGKGSVTWKLALQPGYSLIAATTGAEPAPADFKISWPTGNRAPLAGWFIAGGLVAFVLGLFALIWALVHLRRGRGPRRRRPRLPRPPRPPQLTARTQRALTPAPRRGRRRGFVVVPGLVGGVLLFAGCTASGGATGVMTPTPSGSSSSAAQLAPPAVTVEQFGQIMRRVSATVAKADASLDVTQAAQRLDGPALQERTANYTIRKADSSQSAELALPSGGVKLVLPQQNAGWPRTVFAVVEDATATPKVDFALTLIQASPRDQYKVHYAARLQPKAVIPDVAAAGVGAPRLSADVKFLKLEPSELAGAYASVLQNGSSSPDWALFDNDRDLLRPQLTSTLAAAVSSVGSAGLITVTDTPGSGQTIVFGTNNGGAIVMLDLIDTWTTTPTGSNAAIQPRDGQVKTLSGVSQTTKGIQANYGLQLFFSVPAAGAEGDKITLLGFSQGLVAASELR